MKKIIIYGISIILLVIICTKIKNHYKPYEYADEISKLDIRYNSKIINFNRSVSDFDGSISMRIEFQVDNNELNNIENQCVKLNYKHPPVLLGKDSARYSGNPKFIYYFSVKNKNGSNFVIFHKTKKLLLIEQNTIN